MATETAAVLLEAVQGEGGVHPARGEYLRGATRLCRERGALLILDEVQTGYGRTGKLFACEHYGIEPDLMTVAKSMAGGLPMGACLIGPASAPCRPASHGSTFGGNPLACAAALAALTVMTALTLPRPLRRRSCARRALRAKSDGPAASPQLAADPRGARARAAGRRRSEGQGDARPAEAARRPASASWPCPPAPPSCACCRRWSSSEDDLDRVVDAVDAALR